MRYTSLSSPCQLQERVLESTEMHERTYLENRLRIRPDGVVSKKLMGERKMENAIRSCIFREA